ncbi:hypothetical protein [Inovirus D_HF3_10]|nr:hypothetical protein [Inovirus D_HF3_10]DAJ52154.1 MAG TPA: hypothetical protein [Inoviridae sp.]
MVKPLRKIGACSFSFDTKHNSIIGKSHYCKDCNTCTI